jgi:dihydroorotase
LIIAGLPCGLAEIKTRTTMNERILIKNIAVVSDQVTAVRDVVVHNGIIEKIGNNLNVNGAYRELAGDGFHLLPGAIDDQVHFREPGLTHKANIATESRAAVAGGVTSFMEMPNTNPPALTIDLLEQKYAIAAQCSPANYSFFMGVSNSNSEEVLKVNGLKKDICGVKIFMGSSTGDMLVDDAATLERIFAGSELLIATHCEDEHVIAANKSNYPNPDNASYHPLIRDVEACYKSSSFAISLARKHGTRLHILHISTEKELALFDNKQRLEAKKITSEVCVHHLHFTADDYGRLGNLIKCNPAIKAASNKAALWSALLDDRLDIIATDHAPHTWEEKLQPYKTAPAGVPLVQHSVLLMLDYVKSGALSIEKMVEKMSHAPAKCFQIADRGYIREGYKADVVMVDLNRPYTVDKSNILYKCNWSPFEGHAFSSTIVRTLVNGHVVYENGRIVDAPFGQRLQFDR